MLFCRFCFPRLLSIALAALCVWGSTSPSWAVSSSPALVTIRFNAPQVNYQNSLYQAIARATQVKPSVMFELVSVAPKTGDAGLDARWREAASAHAQVVLANMVQMGVPQSRIAVRGTHESGLRSDEVRLMVR